jgi:hypothetical protein
MKLIFHMLTVIAIVSCELCNSGNFFYFSRMNKLTGISRHLRQGEYFIRFLDDNGLILGSRFIKAQVNQVVIKRAYCKGPGICKLELTGYLNTKLIHQEYTFNFMKDPKCIPLFYLSFDNCNKVITSNFIRKYYNNNEEEKTNQTKSTNLSFWTWFVNRFYRLQIKDATPVMSIKESEYLFEIRIVSFEPGSKPIFTTAMAYSNENVCLEKLYYLSKCFTFRKYSSEEVNNIFSQVSNLPVRNIHKVNNLLRMVFNISPNCRVSLEDIWKRLQESEQIDEKTLVR